MRLDRDIWLRKLWWWLPAVLFFVVNLGLFSTYRLVYAGRVESLRDDLAAAEEQRASLEREASKLSARVRAVRTTRERMGDLYGQRFATERTRFTALAAEIRQLAERAGLEPKSISYPREEVEDFGLVKRYFTFSVEGSYDELRQFVNLLELTPSFVTLEQVALSGDAGSDLRIRLSLSTLFADEEALPRPEIAAGGATS